MKNLKNHLVEKNTFAIWRVFISTFLVFISTFIILYIIYYIHLKINVYYKFN